MKFQEKLVILRKIKGITQDEFASAVGVSRQAVYKWESGQSYPEVPKLLEMKLLFSISIDDLLDENFEVALPEKKRRRRKLTDEQRAEIEKSVQKETKIAPVKEEAPKAAPAPKAEPVAAAPAPKAEPAPVAAPALKAEPAPAPAVPAAEEPAKKSGGFFSKLFGKK